MGINKKIGNLGEKIAEKYLIRNGYSILDKNHREKFDEIDIIARRHDGVLIFCEVKTRNIYNSTYREYFTPEDNLSSAKLKKLIRGSRTYIARHPWMVIEERGWQIDLIAITLTEGRSIEIHHYENV
jgi:putative endonuclease